MSTAQPIPYRYDTIYATYHITANNSSNSQADAWEDVVEIVEGWLRRRLVADDDTITVTMTCRQCRRLSRILLFATVIRRIGKVCCPHCGQQVYIDRPTYDAELAAYYARRRSSSERINRWSEAEIGALIDLLRSGMAIDDIFDHFRRYYNRTKWAVHNRIRELVRSNDDLRECELRCRTATLRRDVLLWLNQYQANEWIPYRMATQRFHTPGDHFPALIQLLYSDKVIDIKRGTDGRIVAIARKARD